MHVSEGAAATLEANAIVGNRLCGVEVEGTRGRLVARRNELRGNGSAWSLPEGASGHILEANVLT